MALVISLLRQAQWRSADLMLVLLLVHFGDSTTNGPKWATKTCGKSCGHSTWQRHHHYHHQHLASTKTYQNLRPSKQWPLRPPPKRIRSPSVLALVGTTFHVVAESLPTIYLDSGPGFCCCNGDDLKLKQIETVHIFNIASFRTLSCVHQPVGCFKSPQLIKKSCLPAWPNEVTGRPHVWSSDSSAPRLRLELAWGLDANRYAGDSVEGIMFDDVWWCLLLRCSLILQYELRDA